MMKLKKHTKSALCIGGVLILAALLLMLPLKSDAEVYDKLIRLHVLANSDSAEDQALKLTVRDALLDEVAAITAGAADRAEAEARLLEKTDALAALAEKTLRENGSSLPVQVTLGKENYPTREYEGMRLPAGEYSSLRVLIGEAEGQNWWCVLFPPLCVGSAVKVEEEMLSVGFTPGQVEVLTDTERPAFRLRFKLLELFGSLFS